MEKYGISFNPLFLKKRYWAIMLLIFLLFSNCSSQSNNNSTYRIPEKLGDGWEVSSLEAEGMNTNKIVSLTEDIRNDKFKGFRSLLIIKNGKLVHEAYFNGYDRDDLHEIYSITKSVSSTLIGISIDNGFIKSVDESVLSLMPQYTGYIEDERKYDIKLKHLLTISSGLDWDEKTYSYSDPRNTETMMFVTEDWMKFVLMRPLVDIPGTRHVYNTGSVHLLSAIIKNSTDLYADKFAEKYLFEPLGISQYYWNKDPMGYQCTGATHGGLRLKPRDLAKFGMVFLRNGKWKEKQIVSEDWVREATTKHISTGGIAGMGYLWWPGSFTISGTKINFIDSYGYGGQALHLIPELDLMYVFTCWSEEDAADTLGPSLLILQSAIED